jgi:hypothetical protein
MRTRLKRYPQIGSALIAASCSLAGCSDRHFSATYATVSVQKVNTRSGTFEILDRPEISRVAITPVASCSNQTDRPALAEPLKAGGYAKTCPTTVSKIAQTIEGWLPYSKSEENRSHSPGSVYAEPLRDYFAQSGRSCTLVRGHILIEPQWEFVYNCDPGRDPSALQWTASGRSPAWPPAD